MRLLLTLAFLASFTSSLAFADSLLLTPIEREVPTFQLLDLESAPWTEESLAGKPYIINFWASWCAPCVHELPAFNRAAAQLLDQDVGMIAVNVGEGTDAVKAFTKEVPIDFTVLLGDSSSLMQWRVKGLPATYIVSAEGEIVAEAVGPREWDNAEFIDYMLSLRSPQ